MGWQRASGAGWGGAGVEEDGGALGDSFVGIVAEGVTHFVADCQVEQRRDRHVPRGGEFDSADGRVEQQGFVEVGLPGGQVRESGRVLGKEAVG